MILGLDPGTTVGWALLDLDGVPLAVSSRREFSASDIISDVIRHGRVLFVGTDKAKVPVFVQEVATRLGARVIAPSADLRVVEKRDWTKGMSFANAHEMDAIASGLVAARGVRRLVERVRSFLRNAHKGDLFDDVFELVARDRVSIQDALRALTPDISVKIDVDDLPEPNERKWFSAFRRARKDNLGLLRRCVELERALKASRQRERRLREKLVGLVKPRTNSHVKREHARSLAGVQALLAKERERANLAQEESLMLERDLLDSSHVAVPRLRKLGRADVDDCPRSDVVFVDDVNEFSEHALEELIARGVSAIVSAKSPGRRARERLPVPCIRAEDVDVRERVVLIDKAWLSQARSRKDVLAKVVREYQKIRSRTGLR